MVQLRPNIEPILLHWAIVRSGKDPDTLQARFPKLPDWETGRAKPTLKQLEDFAKATYTPIGYLFLSEPPVEQVPIPDFRTVGNRFLGHPSPNLLETIYSCQERQTWYREHVRTARGEALPLVGSEKTTSDPHTVAGRIRHAIGFDLEMRRQCATWTDALRMFVAQVDASGVMVMASGVVKNNNKRPLNPHEFRGFALSDVYAPLIFLNGADTKAAQMFTLAHELAHIYLGKSALSDATAESVSDNTVERWCNQVAAELLVPLETIREDYRPNVSLDGEVARLARKYKVSTLVILRRLFDSGFLSRTAFQAAYDAELERLLALPTGSGGNFYLTQGARASKRFVRALIMDTFEGQTLFRDAQRMLGISKMETFVELGRSLNLPL